MVLDIAALAVAVLEVGAEKVTELAPVGFATKTTLVTTPFVNIEYPEVVEGNPKNPPKVNVGGL